MRPTDIKVPDYFHKVVDCQWACPAHTPVPEYIRMIAAGRYADAEQEWLVVRKLLPREPGVWLDLGGCRERGGPSARALGALIS